jgi:HEAT repeat protein
MDQLQTALLDLKSSNGETRELALDQVGTLKPKQAFEIILPFLRDPDSEVRGTAACNLGYIRDFRAIEPLLEAVRDEHNEEVRFEALSALDNYFDPTILHCLINEVYRRKNARGPRQIVARQLSKYNCEDSVDALIVLLEDEDIYVRIFAVDSLLKLNRSRLRQIWQRVIQDESDYVSDIAKIAISQLDSQSSWAHQKEKVQSSP